MVVVAVDVEEAAAPTAREVAIVPAADEEAEPSSVKSDDGAGHSK